MGVTGCDVIWEGTVVFYFSIFHSCFELYDSSCWRRSYEQFKQNFYRLYVPQIAFLWDLAALAATDCMITGSLLVKNLLKRQSAAGDKPTIG